MIKKILFLFMITLMLFGVCIHQFTYLTICPTYTQEFGEPILDNPMLLVDRQHSSAIFNPYSLQLTINEPSSSDVLKPGIYKGEIKTYFQSFPFQYHVIDTTAPKVTLENDEFTLFEGDPFELDLILPKLHINDLSSVKSIQLLDHQTYYEIGCHEIFLEVADVFENTTTIQFTLNVEPKYESSPSSPSHPIYSQTTPVPTIPVEVCSNGNPKINPNKACHEPAYDEYPYKIGSLEELQAYAKELHKSHFITNITLNDGSEAYGLWLSDES